jgi:hypothetical protein
MKVLTVTTRKFQAFYDNTPLEDIMSLLNLQDPEDAPSYIENERLRLRNEISIINHFSNKGFTHIFVREGWIGIETINNHLQTLKANLKAIQ